VGLTLRQHTFKFLYSQPTYVSPEYYYSNFYGKRQASIYLGFYQMDLSWLPLLHSLMLLHESLTFTLLVFVSFSLTLYFMYSLISSFNIHLFSCFRLICASLFIKRRPRIHCTTIRVLRECLISNHDSVGEIFISYDTPVKHTASGSQVASPCIETY
jgi:hypothetical protein